MFLKTPIRFLWWPRRLIALIRRRSSFPLWYPGKCRALLLVQLHFIEMTFFYKSVMLRIYWSHTCHIHIDQKILEFPRLFHVDLLYLGLSISTFCPSNLNTVLLGAENIVYIPWFWVKSFLPLHLLIVHSRGRIPFFAPANCGTIERNLIEWDYCANLHLKPHGLADFEKVFDRVEYASLYRAFQYFNFGQVIIMP